MQYLIKTRVGEIRREIAEFEQQMKYSRLEVIKPKLKRLLTVTASFDWKH